VSPHSVSTLGTFPEFFDLFDVTHDLIQCHQIFRKQISCAEVSVAKSASLEAEVYIAG
jgi:hypothetical protein